MSDLAIEDGPFRPGLRLVHSVPEVPTPPCSSCSTTGLVVPASPEADGRYHCGHCNTVFLVAGPAPAHLSAAR